MYDKFLKYYDDEYKCDVYFKRTKLSNGQLAEILFEETYRVNKFIDYNVVFVIGSKRKNLNCSKMDSCSTGKVGLEGLIWAKKQIIEFEKFILKSNHKEKVYISVLWSDNRRRKVYERGLKKLGFKYQFAFGHKKLRKKIN